MNANVTALRPGRTRALVQRKHRKMHVASIGAGDTDWLTMCGRWVPVDGTATDLHPSPDTIQAHSEDFCTTCGWIFALINFEVSRALASLPTARLRAVR